MTGLSPVMLNLHDKFLGLFFMGILCGSCNLSFRTYELFVAPFLVSEYVDGVMIPKNTSVLIRRVPGRPRKPIVTERVEYYLGP